MSNTNLMVKELTNFDHSYESDLKMYDNLPYQRDLSVCGWEQPQLQSGNIVKFYQYTMAKPQIIQAPTEEFEIPEYRILPVEENITEENDDNIQMDAFEEGAALVNDAEPVTSLPDDNNETEEAALPNDDLSDEDYTEDELNQVVHIGNDTPQNEA